MPNVLTNLQDIRIADTFLQTFVAALTPFRAFSTDFSAEFIERGKTVNVPIIGEAQESHDFAGSYSEHADRSIDSIPVVLSRHKVQSINLQDKEVAESSWVTLERLATGKARQLAQDVLEDIWSAVTAARYGAAVWTGTSEEFDAAAVLKVRGACARNNMPLTERNLILDDAYYSNLLGDPKVSQSFIVQMSSPVILDARLPRLSGFDLHETTILPDNGENLIGFAAHPSGMAVAMRYLQPISAESYLEAGPVADPTTGITIGYRRYYDPDSGKMIAAFECLYGFTPAITSGIKRLVAPTP
jgi:hypothetical protein